MYSNLSFISPAIAGIKFHTVEKPKYDVIDRSIYFDRDGDIITTAVIEKLKVRKSEPVVEFHDYYVRVNNHLHRIMVEEKGDVYSIFGTDIHYTKSKREFIIVDGKTLYIEKDAMTKKKFLSEK